MQCVRWVRLARTINVGRIRIWAENCLTFFRKLDLLNTPKLRLWVSLTHLIYCTLQSRISKFCQTLSERFVEAQKAIHKWHGTW